MVYRRVGRYVEEQSDQFKGSPRDPKVEGMWGGQSRLDSHWDARESRCEFLGHCRLLQAREQKREEEGRERKGSRVGRIRKNAEGRNLSMEARAETGFAEGPDDDDNTLAQISVNRGERRTRE